MPEDTPDIDAIRQELQELKDGEERGMIRLPPASKTDGGEDLSGYWTYATLVPPKFVRYHFWHKAELSEYPSEAGSQIVGPQIIKPRSLTQSAPKRRKIRDPLLTTNSRPQAKPKPRILHSIPTADSETHYATALT